MLFLDHIWLIPLFPAFGAAMMFFFGRRLQKATVNAVCIGVVVIAFLFACFAVVEYTHFAHGTGRLIGFAPSSNDYCAAEAAQ